MLNARKDHLVDLAEDAGCGRGEGKEKRGGEEYVVRENPKIRRCAVVTSQLRLLALHILISRHRDCWTNKQKADIFLVQIVGTRRRDRAENN